MADVGCQDWWMHGLRLWSTCLETYVSTAVGVIDVFVTVGANVCMGGGQFLSL